MTSTTNRLIVVLVLTVALTGGLFWLILQLQERAVALEEVLQTIANKAAVEREYAALSALLDQTADERAQVADYFVQGQAGSIAFLERIEALAAANAVALTSPRLTTGDSPALGVPVLQLTYSLDGPQLAVETFIAQVEQLPVGSYLQDLSLATRTEAGSAPRMTGTVTIHAIITDITETEL